MKGDASMKHAVGSRVFSVQWVFSALVLLACEQEQPAATSVPSAQTTSVTNAIVPSEPSAAAARPAGARSATRSVATKPASKTLDVSSPALPGITDADAKLLRQ